MKLGEAFPPGLAIQITDQNIKRGLVVRDHLQAMKPPKIKRFVLVGLDVASMTAKIAIINSKIPPFAVGKPRLESLQIPLSPVGYAELVNHDSFINCMEVISVDFQKLRKRLYDQDAQILGHLSDADTKLVISKLLSAKSISKNDKTVLQSPINLPE
ncbi:MAG: hypothetical protein V1792_01440 [Pseudomonadota bacterium]